MKKARLFYSIGVIVGCCLAMLLFCSIVQANGAANVSINPASGAAGTPITITGSGFKAGEEVDITLILGEGQLIGLGTQKVEAIVADANGAFSVESAVPRMAKPGRYDVEVEGSKGSYVKTSLEAVKKK